MTDAEFEEQRLRLRALTEKWVGPLGLGWWAMEWVYAREEYEPPGTTARNDSLAHCHCDWRYGHATITWNMPKVREIKDDELERAFVHELCHIFLNEMRWTAANSSDSLDHEERVASTLTKAFLWLRESLQAETTQPAPDAVSA